jgi:hypothetical protein
VKTGNGQIADPHGFEHGSIDRDSTQCETADRHRADRNGAHRHRSNREGACCTSPECGASNGQMWWV